jgi:uracil-DNA glycosylase
MSHNNEQKRIGLLALAKKRQAHRSDRYFNLNDFHDGFYECDFVSPWTISANNVNASLMLIAQDWSSFDSLTQAPDEELRQIGQTWKLRTNRNLRDFLQRHFKLRFADTYATNLFPFIKKGKLNARIRDADLRDCAEEYAVPQINIVNPKMVLCLGKQTFDALRYVLYKDAINWVDASHPGSHTHLDGTEIYGVPHTGSWGTNNAGGMPKVDEIWKRLADRLAEISASRVPVV